MYGCSFHEGPVTKAMSIILPAMVGAYSVLAEVHIAWLWVMWESFFNVNNQNYQDDVPHAT